jgi:hypothetical protein
MGSLLFVVDQYRSASSDQIITITQGDIDKIRSQWKAQSDKELTNKILQGLLQDEINQQRLYKEALSLNLDHDDVIIKRRLIQKLRFVMTELSNSSKPTILELRQFYENNKANYTRSSAISFRHIFLGLNDSSKKSSAQVSVLLTELNQSTNSNKDWQLFGKPFMHGNYFSNHSIEQLLLQFNPSFVNELISKKAGKWSGPIDSLYGAHLVFVERIQPVSKIDFEKSISLIEHDYRQSKEADNYQAYLKGLAGKYPIVIESLDDDLIKEKILFE